MSVDIPSVLTEKISAQQAARPQFSSDVEAQESVRAPFVSLFNFPPADFAFYQQAPSAGGADPLTQNLLSGALHFDPECRVQVSPLKIAGGNAANPLEGITIELWVNVPSTASTSAVFFSYTDTSNNILALRNPVALEVYSYTASTATQSSSDSMISSSGGSSAVTVQLGSGLSIVDGIWHHLALVIGADRKPQLFLDTRAATLTGSTTTIGALPKDGGKLVVANSEDGTKGLGGYVGQVRVWKTARPLSLIVASAGTVVPVDENGDLSLLWSSRVDEAEKKFYDSTPCGNNGTVHLSAQPPQPWWNATIAYGALEDGEHLTPHPVNMTGCLVLDRSAKQAVKCGSSHLGLTSSGTALTFEFWVKAASANATSATIVRLRLSADDTETDSVNLDIGNPRALTVTCGSLRGYSFTVETLKDLCDGRWHHVAVVVRCAVAADQNSTFTTDVYVDTFLLKSGTSNPLAWVGTSPSLLLGSDDQGAATDHFFSGSIAEFRLWESARTAEQILSDASARIASPPPELRVYWPFARDFRTAGVVEDFSSYNSRGSPQGSPGWDDSEVFGVYASHLVVPPVPSAASGAGDPSAQWAGGTVSADGSTELPGAGPGFPSVSEADLSAAFEQAQHTGYFDPRYFPNIRNVASARDRHNAATAIATLTTDDFISSWRSGRRLDLQRGKHGRYRYTFTATPADLPTARLMLVETYRLSSFLGDVGQGQVVRTFSLMPGETTLFSVSTFKETSATAETASTVLDSYNESSQAAFENSLSTDQNTETSEAAELSFYANGDVKQRWGTGNVDVSAGLSGSGSISHARFFQQTTNALLTHAAEASSARNVEVNTTYSVQTQTNRQTSITREFRNVNTGRTLDVIFRQVLQEYLAVLHLVDVRVAYYDPNPGSFRVVALPELDQLLDAVLLDDPAKKLAYKQTIVGQVYALTQLCQANPTRKFLVAYDKATGAMSDFDPEAITADQAYAIDPLSRTQYAFPFHTGRTLDVKGLVMAHTPVVLRTDNVVAEAMVGASVALDPHNLALQALGLERQRLELDLRRAEIAKLTQANAIVASGDETRASLYAQVFPPPRVNNNVMYADETGAHVAE